MALSWSSLPSLVLEQIVKHAVNRQKAKDKRYHKTGITPEQDNSILMTIRNCAEVCVHWKKVVSQMQKNTNFGTLVYRLSDRATAELLIKEGYHFNAKGLIIGYPATPDVLCQFEDSGQLCFDSFIIGAKKWDWRAWHFDSMINILKNSKPRLLNFTITIDNQHTLELFWNFLTRLLQCRSIKQLHIHVNESQTIYDYMNESVIEMNWDFLHAPLPIEKFGVIRKVRIQFEHEAFTAENLTISRFVKKFLDFMPVYQEYLDEMRQVYEEEIMPYW